MKKNRLRLIRRIRGISGTKVAEALHITPQYYYEIERGEKRLSAEMLAKLAEFFGVSTDYILGFTDDPGDSELVLGLPDESDGNKIVREKIEMYTVGKRIQVPIIGTVKAGPDGLAYEDHMGMEWADEDSINGGEYVYLVVKGDSMIGEGIMPGDLALVRIQPDVNSGDLAVVIVDKEEGTLKRVLKRGTGIILRSANPDYPDRLFAGEDVERVKIVGKVKEIKRKF